MEKNITPLPEDTCPCGAHALMDLGFCPACLDAFRREWDEQERRNAERHGPIDRAD